MQHRSKHLTCYSFLIGLLLLSVGFNFLFYNKIISLERMLYKNNVWISGFELSQIEKEIDRLDKETKSVLKHKGE